MTGWIFNTLSHRLAREEAEWRSENDVRREKGYGYFRGVLVCAAEHPIGWPLATLIFLSIVLIALLFAPKCWFPSIDDNFGSADLIAYFSALWAVQSAVAALVYPIVIAFVTLLLQRRHSAKANLHIYLHDTAAILAGLSTLFLIILMAFQYLLLIFQGVRGDIAIVWLSIDGVWFLVNLGLTSSFLFRTFQFVLPSSRAEIVQRHAINVIWPRELKAHLASYFFLAAVGERLLPGPNYGATTEEDMASIWLGPSGMKSGSPVIERTLKRNSKLTDIRFRLLAQATASWQSRSQRSKEAASQIDSHSRNPVIIYPLYPGYSYSGKTAICSVIGPFPVSKFEQFLIRRSFKFKCLPDTAGLVVEDVFDDLKEEALQALQAGAPQTFADIVDQMMALYVNLLEASACKSTEGFITNYTQVPDRRYTLGRPVFEVWTMQFTELFDATAERISADEAFFIKLIHVPGRLFSSLDDVAPTAILTRFVELPLILFHRLGRWWVKTIEQQGVIEHDACNASSLRPPFFGVYDSILRRFVGEWETLKNYRFLLGKNEDLSWQDFKVRGQYLESHLQATARMTVECVHRGDKTGAEWTTDVLLKWFPELQFRFDVHSHFFRREKLLSFQITEQPWKDAEGALDIEESYIQGSRPKALFSVVLRNYWVDVCCIVAYMLAIRGKSCSCDRSVPAFLLRFFVYGEHPKHDSHAVDIERPVASANDLFIAILRQYHSEGGYREGYRARLDNLVERLVSQTKEEMVPGRIYSGWGTDDLSSLRDGQLILLSLLMPAHWNPITEIERTINEWIREDDAKLRDLLVDLKQWKHRITQPEFGEYRALFECVKGAHDGPSFDEAMASLNAGIDQVIAKVESVRAEAIRDLPISEARLDEVGKWASAAGFNKDSGLFPLPLFREVSFTNEELQRRNLTLKGIAKGEFTEPPMAQCASNEAEWYGQTVRDHVAAFALDQVIRRLSPEEKDGSAAETYWEQMKRYGDEADRLKRHAILLIENRTIPNWIFEWTHPFREQPEERPPDLEVWRDSKIQLDSYLGHLNKVAVYQAPIPPGASVLLTAESLKSISFTKFSNGNYVIAEALPVKDKTDIIDLKLTWMFEVDIDAYPAIKLVYGGSGRRRRR